MLQSLVENIFSILFRLFSFTIRTPLRANNGTTQSSSCYPAWQCLLGWETYGGSLSWPMRTAGVHSSSLTSLCCFSLVNHCTTWNFAWDSLHPQARWKCGSWLRHLEVRTDPPLFFLFQINKSGYICRSIFCAVCSFRKSHKTRR